MKTIDYRRSARAAFGVLLSVPVSCLFAQPSRIEKTIDAAHSVVLRGNQNRRYAGAEDEGPLDALTQILQMRIVLSSTPEQSAALERLLESQRDPSSPDYQRWLTPEEYADRFGASSDDIAKITQWLEAQGFAVDQTARARNWIAFSGPAGKVAQTFQTELHRYRWHGETHFANVSDPSIPAALAGIASEIRGLDDFRLRPPRAKKIAPDYTASSGAHYLAPDDLAAIYDITPLYRNGYDGTGQKLAIVGQTDINIADIRGFRSQFGLAAKDPQLVLYGPDPGVSSGDQIESDLDLEWSGAVARNATIVFVYSQDVMASLEYAIDQNIAPAISMSYGGCEIGTSSSNRSLAQQANAEGITWLNSSGDSGAAGCDYDGPAAAQYGPAVTFPADIPEVTAVGGTEFNESGSAGWSSTNSSTWQSANGYLPEKGWNDTSLGDGIWASGGGASVVFSKPSWQAGPGVPNDNARDVPDVALTASGDHDGYLMYMSGQLFPVGGTSASSPSFAGIVTLLNHYLTANAIQAKPGLGNINPTLYNLAQNGNASIHDVTTGNNIVPCVARSTGCTTGSFGYSAGVGYDQVTGVGSVDAYNLVTNWHSLPPVTGTSMTVSASPQSIAASATAQITAKVTAASGSNPPTGSVNFTLGGASIGSAALVASGNSATATIAVKGSSLTLGANSIAASYSATSAFGGASGAVTVTVAASTPVATSTTVTATPASVVSNGTLQLGATVTPASGSAAPTGTVTFLAGNTALGTATLSASGAASLSVSAGKLAAGANSITASYAGSASFAASASQAVTVTVTAPSISTSATVAANPTSIAQSASTTLTVNVSASSGSASPAGTVAFTAGAVALGTATLSGSGGTATATFTLRGSNLSVGNNSVLASYSGNGTCGPSSASVAITVTGPTVATTTTVAAVPPVVAQNASTAVTAFVRPASGSSAPSGTVTFALGNASLGSQSLSAATGGAVASLSVPGSRLALGNNTITATYSGGDGFSVSSGTVLIVATAPAVATAMTLTASATNIAQTGSTQLTATVKAASGSLTSPGTVVFMAGSLPLGAISLASSSATATATLTVSGSILSPGNNTITASYAGNSAFAPSNASTVVTVASAASNVVATVTKTSDGQPGLAVKIQLQETAGASTTLTGFTINGTNFTPSIGAMLGTTQVAPHALLTSTINIEWSPLPQTLTFVFTGVDPSGRRWTQTVSLATN